MGFEGLKGVFGRVVGVETLDVAGFRLRGFRALVAFRSFLVWFRVQDLGFGV